MSTVAPALAYALFVWWFATGLVLLMVVRGRTSACLGGAALVFPLALYGLVRSGSATGVAGAYVAFTMAILLWGTQEVAFLTGVVTGPRPVPKPPGASGTARLRAALGAILYHEIALIVTGLAVLAATWHAPNQVGALTFLLLWVMRLSAKLNLFLGVPVLNDDLLPRDLGFLRSHFRQAPASAFFPVSMVFSLMGLSWLTTSAADPDVSTAAEVGYLLVAALMVLAIVEHVFMLLPLPVARLWAWSGGKGRPVRHALDEPGCEDVTGKMERVAITSPSMTASCR